MTLVQTTNDVHFIFCLEENISIQKSEYILNLLSQKKIPINPYDGFNSSNYYYLNKKNELLIFNSTLEKIKSIKINCPLGITIFDKNNYVISYLEEKNKKLQFVLDSKIISTEPRFYGKILNENYRLNFPEGVFNNPRTFRCSDLLDTKTYWEYNCTKGEHVRSGFTVYEDKLLFYTHSEPAPFEYYYWVNVLDLHTGETLHKIPSRHIGACFDEKNGMFVAVSGSIMNQQDYKVYEIIDVNTGKKQIGDISCEDNFVTVGTAMQHIYENRLYFIDNFITIGGKKYCENPKIGCFDFIKRELIYFKEIPNFKKKAVAQIIRSDDKIYIRTQYFELYIFEEEN